MNHSGRNFNQEWVIECMRMLKESRNGLLIPDRAAGFNTGNGKNWGVPKQSARPLLSFFPFPGSNPAALLYRFMSHKDEWNTAQSCWQTHQNAEHHTMLLSMLLESKLLFAKGDKLQKLQYSSLYTLPATCLWKQAPVRKRDWASGGGLGTLTPVSTVWMLFGYFGWLRGHLSSSYHYLQGALLDQRALSQVRSIVHPCRR